MAQPPPHPPTNQLVPSDIYNDYHSSIIADSTPHFTVAKKHLAYIPNMSGNLKRERERERERETERQRERERERERKSKKKDKR